jgi:hypothetical protein
LAIPIDLRAAKALPKNCGRRPLVSRKTLEKGRGGFEKVNRTRTYSLKKFLIFYNM